MAEAIGVSLVTYNRWENKPILPKTSYPFLNLSRLLGVSIDYLFSNDANASTYSPDELETVKRASKILLSHAAIKK